MCLASRGALTAVLLGDPLGGERAQGAASLGVGCKRATDLSLAVIIAAVQVAGLVEGPGIQQAVTRLEEALQLGELLTGIFTLQGQHRCVVARLGQSHVLGLITARGKRRISDCQSYYPPHTAHYGRLTWYPKFPVPLCQSLAGKYASLSTQTKVNGATLAFIRRHSSIVFPPPPPEGNIWYFICQMIHYHQPVVTFVIWCRPGSV